MKIIPHGKEEWLGFLVFPFKAYIVIAPVLFFISSALPRLRHTGATYIEAILIAGLFPCSFMLLLAAVIFALTGPKGIAGPCLVFCAIGLLVAFTFLPSLASA